MVGHFVQYSDPSNLSASLNGLFTARLSSLNQIGRAVLARGAFLFSARISSNPHGFGGSQVVDTVDKPLLKTRRILLYLISFLLLAGRVRLK